MLPTTIPSTLHNTSVPCAIPVPAMNCHVSINTERIPPKFIQDILDCLYRTFSSVLFLLLVFHRGLAEILHYVLYVFINKAQLPWMGGVSIISDTLSSVSGTISDLKTIVLILTYPNFNINILFFYHRVNMKFLYSATVQTPFYLPFLYFKHS